eukprot:1738169-Pyramimonas_sp.AAC.1
MGHVNSCGRRESRSRDWKCRRAPIGGGGGRGGREEGKARKGTLAQEPRHQRCRSTRSHRETSRNS